ncbi:MAG: SDR family oxidoreductase [Thermoguttaceae bacterium]|nr:SDR family oxidoreductase [Thermoguttaceae bacterium]
MFNLTGKKAVVTGGSIGIGRGYATALAMAGADVAIVNRTEEIGKKTAEELQNKYGIRSFCIACDVTVPEQVEKMMSEAVERLGGLDISVNNAGIALLGADENVPPEDWRKVMDVNVSGMFYCCQAAGKVFIRQGRGGKIINTASMSARIMNCNASYNASKGAVVQLTRMLAAEWGRFNINVNCLSPSYILTPMHASSPLKLRERIRELTPLGYVERPEDLYGPLIFLASDASNYVTGTDLLVDGGHTLNSWLVPLKRELPPRVTPEEEVVQLKHDLDLLGIPYDENGINEELHPNMAEAFKAMFS